MWREEKRVNVVLGGRGVVGVEEWKYEEYFIQASYKVVIRKVKKSAVLSAYI